MRQQPILVAIFLMAASTSAFGWNDLTHMAVMKAAGLDNDAYLAVGADMAKEKAGGHEDGNHYCDNKRGTVVTEDLVLDQVRDYNCRCGEGHVYGAIVAALNDYRERRNRNKYARYPLGYAAHYIADLSMPLHNVEYNDFNKANHSANDGVVEKGESGTTDERVARIARNIQQRMKSIKPYALPPAREGVKAFNSALARKIAEIGNGSIALGFAMQDADPPRTLMTTSEAYGRLAESAMLLKAAYAALEQ